MKYLITTILLALAPLGWGEDVYYCFEELSYAIEEDDYSRYGLQQYEEEKFTFKYEESQGRLAIVGITFSGEKPFYLDCIKCFGSQGAFIASNNKNLYLMMKNGRFFFTSASFTTASMKTGTCTKF